MTVDHLVGYALIVPLLGALVFSMFAETFMNGLGWVRRLHRVQDDWPALRLDLALVAEQPLNSRDKDKIGQKISGLCNLPANKVFRARELQDIADRYHNIGERETWKVMGASVYRRDRVYEVANHLRVYCALLLALVIYNMFGFVPKDGDLGAIFGTSWPSIIHSFAGLIGKNISGIIAWKETLIIGFFLARLWSERSVFLHFAREE